MSVDVKPGPSFECTPLTPLFNPDDAQINGPSNYAVTSEGQRFLTRVSAPASTIGDHIYVVLNWPTLLVKYVPPWRRRMTQTDEQDRKTPEWSSHFLR